MKEKRGAVQLFIIVESTDSFEQMQEKLEKTLNCSFEQQKHNGTSWNYLARCLGIEIIFDNCRKQNGSMVYALWGWFDHEIRYSDFSLNLDAYDWTGSVDMDEPFITILQAGNCGVWRRPTDEDQEDMDEYLFGLH